MFTFIPCAAGCGRSAITGSNICAVHSAEAEAEAKRIALYIAGEETITDLNAEGLRFDEVDFSGRRFDGCTFQNASFYRCNFSSSFMRVCFFDFANLSECNFEKSNLTFLSFAGASISNSTFRYSEICNVNYGGCVISGVVFDHSKLYNSRFIRANLEDTSIIDCDLKQVNLIKICKTNVIIKSSNTNEAIHTMEQIQK
ncbi:MAG: pentapeptide repeat-containing protein [Treponema sp.]|jgi:uncharacterized protein YjbI with pentapeptide repeats|nr:pentapeptide repeat-containing protein [Treponema sp.]